MSISDALQFEPWLKAQFQSTGGFTALIVLVGINGDQVKPLLSSYVHMIGDELTWPEFSGLLAKSGVKWDGVVVFAETADGKGPVADILARVKLREVEAEIAADPIYINEGHFFDIWGRRMTIEEVIPEERSARQ